MNISQENALRAKLKKTVDVNNKLTRRNRTLELVLKESRRTNEQLSNICNEQLADLRALREPSAIKVGT